jgi:hypothetical protein
MHACKVTARTMMGKGTESKIDKVPVSDNTTSRRVDDTSHDVEDVLSEILKNTNFALQVDESTDITNKTQLLASVRFENEGKIIEFFSVRNCQEQLKVKTFSKSFLLIWNSVVCHGTSVLEF